MKKENNKTTWGNVAGWYDELLSGDDTYQSKVILPNLLRLVSPEGKRIIDIACGQGYFSQALAEAGAHVLGVDISPNLIEIAEKSKSTNLSFGVSSAHAITQAQSGTFDAAVIVLALQNIKEMQETMKEAARVLVSSGRLVLVLNHPCFRIPKKSSWGFDEKENIQYRRMDSYNSSSSVVMDMNPGHKDEEKIQTTSFHKPLQDYFKALSSAGFVVTGLEEWISHKKSEDGPRALAEDVARKEFPMFLTIVAQKQ